MEPLRNTAWGLSQDKFYCLSKNNIASGPRNYLKAWKGSAQGGTELVQSHIAQQCRPGHPVPATKLLHVPDETSKEDLSQEA